MNYPLDPHCQEIIRQYQERRPIFERMETLADAPQAGHLCDFD